MHSNTRYDVIIVGGGIMGSTTAYYLTRKDPALKVAVIERDLAYTRASTTLSMVNARIQFSLRQNVEISQYAFNVLEHFEDDMTVAGNRPSIAYHREGNLFLYEEPAAADARTALAMQQALGCQVQWWSPDEIMAHYPLYETEGFAGGTFGAQDGHFDAYAVLMGYKANARAQGAVYIEDEVTELVIDKRQITGVKTASGATCIIRRRGQLRRRLVHRVGQNRRGGPAREPGQAPVLLPGPGRQTRRPAAIDHSAIWIVLPDRNRGHGALGEINGRRPGGLRFHLGPEPVHGSSMAGTGRIRSGFRTAEAGAGLGGPVCGQHPGRQRHPR
jgi:FAD-dependent oxidoreductase domain-containing protein 1